MQRPDDSEGGVRWRRGRGRSGEAGQEGGGDCFARNEADASMLRASTRDGGRREALVAGAESSHWRAITGSTRTDRRRKALFVPHKWRRWSEASAASVSVGSDAVQHPFANAGVCGQCGWRDGVESRPSARVGERWE